MSAIPHTITATAYLQPGQLLVTAEPTIVTTILGSCVAVCLWDESTGIGGLNHFMLPYHAGGDSSNPRFGNIAFQQLMGKLRALGADMRRLRARVYGGSCMFPTAASEHLGQKNATVAFDLLRDAGIPVVGSETGGIKGRKLIFDTASGTAFVKTI